MTKETVALLRRIANEIEAGDHGPVSSCAVVFRGANFGLFGSGGDARSIEVHELLTEALQVQVDIAEHIERRKDR